MSLEEFFSIFPPTLTVTLTLIQTPTLIWSQFSLGAFVRTPNGPNQTTNLYQLISSLTTVFLVFLYVSVSTKLHE